MKGSTPPAKASPADLSTRTRVATIRADGSVVSIDIGGVVAARSTSDTMSHVLGTDGHDRPLLVLYWPKWPDQPYLEDLAAGLAGVGVRTLPLTIRSFVRHRRSVIHIHWPETVVSGLLRLPPLLRTIGRAVRLIAMSTAVGVCRLRRQPLVVTLHNLGPHDSDKRLPILVLREIARRADVVVTLTDGGARRARRLYPQLRDATIEVVPIMDGAERYPTVDRNRARASFGIPPAAPLIVFFGRVRPYKGLEKLAASFLELRGAPHLLILGEGDLTDPELAATLAAHERVVWHNERLADRELARGLSAADLVVLPFLRIENSASVIAALTTGVRVLVPDLEPMRELAAEYGCDRVLLYEGELTADTLQRHLDETPTGERTRPAVPHRGLGAVGRRQREVYELAVSRSGGRSTPQ